MSVCGPGWEVDGEIEQVILGVWKKQLISGDLDPMPNALDIKKSI